MNAFLDGLNQMGAAGLAALLNTLWYAAAVVALTWVVLRYSRRVNAATRYWIWTAVLGFLVVLPFLPALVANAGAAKSGAPAAAAPLATIPTAPQAVQHLAPVMLTLSSAPGSNPWPLWLMAVWIAVAGWQLMRLMRGIISVRRLKARSEKAPAIALPVELSRRVQVLASEEINSPVAVGYRHPAVILPTGLLARLEEGEQQDVLLHELAHLARYDDWLNLATRAVGALLALHPLAGIIVKQIEREREMACDDFVVAHTGSARSYARSLARLHDLRSTEGTRLLAPALLGGKVSLADRIESLLRRERKFSARPSFANLGVSVFLLSMLLGAGGLIPGWVAVGRNASPSLRKTSSQALGATTQTPKFEVASIREDKSATGISRLVGFSTPHDGRFYATGITLKELISFAYDVNVWRISGGPSWINTERFDIEAKAGASVNEELKKLSLHQALLLKERLLQALLTDRFKLKLHRETRELPVFTLVVAKHGPKLQEVEAENLGSGGHKGPKSSGVERALGTRRGEKGVSFQDLPISSLTALLSEVVGGRTVIDGTGLKGKYNFTLRWAPDMGLGRTFGGGPEAQSRLSTGIQRSEPSAGPTIFTALREQLGLKLKPAKGPVQVLVVDHVEPPTPN